MSGEWASVTWKCEICESSGTISVMRHASPADVFRALWDVHNHEQREGPNHEWDGFCVRFGTLKERPARTERVTERPTIAICLDDLYKARTHLTLAYNSAKHGGLHVDTAASLALALADLCVQIDLLERGIP